jgi:1,4-dihydroxy-2-naphthoate octaprenyltransferase
VGGAFVMVALMVVFGVMPVTTLITAVTLPEALRLIRIVTTSNDTALLHQAQGRTAKLHGAFGLWLVIGWVAWLILDVLI